MSRNNAERLRLRENCLSIHSYCNSSMSISSEKSFYERLDENIKVDIHKLIDLGYDRKMVVKLYLIMNPINLNEAIEYLSKKNGLYQHKFHTDSKNKNICEICGEIKENHILENEKTITEKNINNNSSLDFSFVININMEENINNNEKKNCNICFDSIIDNNIDRCQNCGITICKDCLFEHIETLIKEQKKICCPNQNCKILYEENKILSILSKYCKNEEELKDLKKLYEKSKIKFMVLSNPSFIFCPFPDCDGYAKKSTDTLRCKCNLGHIFCYRCGEKWHEKGNCPKDKEVDELFENYVKKLNMKKCPSCGIHTIKKDGCNHITCSCCKKEWCYICGEPFNSTEEHYNNPNSSCFHRMLDGIIQLDICNICSTTVVNNDLINFRQCQHLICENCLISYFNNNLYIKSDIELNIKCPIEGCNRFTSFIYNDKMIKIIKKSKNEILKRQVKIIKKQSWSKVSFRESFNFKNFHDYIYEIKSLLCINNSCFESGCLNAFQKSISYFFLYVIFIFFPFYFFYCIIDYFGEIFSVYDRFLKNDFLIIMIIIQLFIGAILIFLIYFSSLYIYYFYLIAYIIYESFG